MDHPTCYEDGLNAERNGDFKKALRLFQESLSKESPDEGDVYFHFGWCLEQDKDGDSGQALHFYQKASSLARSSICRINSCFRAGWILMHAKEYQRAAAMYKSAIDLGEQTGNKAEIYPHAAYWYAVCLESQGRYLDALDWYRHVRTLSDQLDPECRLREIICLNQVGSYETALQVSLTFENPRPAGFDLRRYEELRAVAMREREMLQACLSVDFRPERPPNLHDDRRRRT